MPEAQVTLTFVVPESRIQELIANLRARAEALADDWRCPDVWAAGDLRCQLERDHGDRHVHNRFSWPTKQEVAPGHVVCPQGCSAMANRLEHHHWQSPTGQVWTIRGLSSNCDQDHLAEWEAGTL